MLIEMNIPFSFFIEGHIKGAQGAQLPYLRAKMLSSDITRYHTVNYENQLENTY